MFRSDTDAVPFDPATPGGWAAPGVDGLDAAPWPARGGFFTGGSAAPQRPGDADASAAVERPGGDGLDAARLDEDDFDEDEFYDDEEDDDDDDLFDDEEDPGDDDDDLLDDDDDEDFDFEDD